MPDSAAVAVSRWTKLEEGCVRDNILYTRLDGSQFQREWSPFLPVNSHYDIDKVASECALLGGGWHVANPQELFTTLNHAKYNPAMDEEIAGGKTGGWVWTSQIDPSDSSYAFYVGLGHGGVSWGTRSGGGLVRLCREVSPRQ
jgi:hypothetical protein